MAGAKRRWTLLLAVTVLLAGTVLNAIAQTALAQQASSGSLTAKLTDLHSTPIDGATVVVRNRATSAEMRATTVKNGTYLFPALEAGEYTIEAESPERGRGRLEGIVIAAGHEARVQAAMQFELPAPRHIQITFHEIPAETPLLTAKMTDEPMRLLPSRMRLIPGFGWKEIPAETALVSTEIALEIPRLLTPPMRLIPGFGWLEIPSETPLVKAEFALKRLRTLAGMYAQDVTRPKTAAAPLPGSPMNSDAPGDMGMKRGTTMEAQGTTPLHPNAARTNAQSGDPVAAAVTSTLTAAELQSLPINGRRWEEFVLDTSAAVSPAGSTQSSMRGASQQPVETSVDGASTSMAFGTTGSRSGSQASAAQSGNGQEEMSQSWNGGRGFAVSESAIREVQTAAGNVEARSMRSAGGRVNVETQGGDNELHGQGFLFDRQNTWGARNPFTQWVQNTGTTAAPVFTSVPYTPPDHEMNWGIGMGSRIRRNKLFWFAALDNSHRNDAGVATVKNAAQFFNTLEPTSQQILYLSARLGETQNQAYNDYLGIATTGYTAAGLEQLANLLGPAQRTSAQWTGFARLDWQAAERHRFTLEGIGANWDSPGGGYTRVSETVGNHSFGSSQASEQWLLARWEAWATPNLLYVTQASAGRDILSMHAETPSAFEQTLNKNIWGQIPQIVVNSSYGFTIGNPARFGQGSYPDERLFHAQEMVDWTRNSLLVKAGFEMSHNADTTGMLRNQTGTYSYSSTANFISDALAFEKYGFSGALDASNPHNCNQAGTALGNLPCYSYYSQAMGPTGWHVSTNDWASYATAQWQPNKRMVASLGLRWEREQMPPPIPTLANSDLPLTEKLPSLGNNWGPRFSLAVGGGKRHQPVLRMGYGMYYDRIHNATLETAMTHTGSANGDLNFFMRPTDDLPNHPGGAPPFPYVFAGKPLSIVKPGAVEFAPNFRNSEIHQAVVAVSESLPGHVQVSASAQLSLGRRLPIAMDTNFDPSVNPGTITYAVVDATGKGPIKTAQITVPFYATWPTASDTAGRANTSYQQITEIMSRANSTYEAATLNLNRYGNRGLSLYAHYTYSHAMDWNPNESTLVTGSDVLDPADFSQEYGTSNLDMRHSASATVIYRAPWKLHGHAKLFGNGWMLSGVGHFRSGLPYTMRTTGSLAERYTSSATIVGLGPGMNGSGGDNRVYGVGRNTYRYPSAWKADMRLSKRFDLGQMRQLDLLAESFNLFNHQNVTSIETTGYYIEAGGTSGSFPSLHYLTQGTTGTAATTPSFGQPRNVNATNFYRERQIQLGLRMRF
jgi:hypothetical protein